jgi:hypothetical protein
MRMRSKRSPESGSFLSISACEAWSPWAASGGVSKLKSRASVVLFGWVAIGLSRMEQRRSDTRILSVDTVGTKSLFIEGRNDNSTDNPDPQIHSRAYTPFGYILTVRRVLVQPVRTLKAHQVRTLSPSGKSSKPATPDGFHEKALKLFYGFRFTVLPVAAD